MPSDSSLIGRDRELSDLRRLIAGTTRTGSARTFEGDAGVGKSALLAAAAGTAHAAGFTVLTCVGVQGRTGSGLSGLHDLLTPVLDRAGALPPRQRSALLTGLGLAGEPAPEGLLLHIAALGLLEEAAGDRPLLLLAEDTQWLDQPSVEVLGFLSRRLGSVPILLLTSRRAGLPDHLAAFGIPATTVEPLDHAASAALLDLRAPELSAAGRARVLQVAAGNPLALRELPAALREHGLADGGALPDHLPLTSRLEQAFSARIAVLPDATRTVLLMLAVAEGTGLGELMAAAGRLGTGLGDLAAAEGADLITVSGDHAGFRHPLVASAVYGTATPDEKLAVHRALADSTANPDQAAWHRARTVHGPDEQVAAELEAAGERATRRGSLADAAKAFRRAADLSPVTAERARRLATAAETARRAGLWTESEAAVQEALRLTTEPAVIVQLAYTHSFMGGTSVDSKELIDLAGFARMIAGPAGTDHPEERMQILVTAAASAYNGFAPEATRAGICRELSTIDLGYPHPAQVMALAILDPVGQAPRLRAGLPALAAGVDDFPQLLLGIGQAAEAMHDLETAAACWTRSAEQFRATGSLWDLCTALLQRGRLSALRGEFTDALADVELSVRMATDLEMTVTVAGGLAVLARVHAWRGDDDEARAALHRQNELERSGARRQSHADFAWARGLIALAQSRHHEAWQELRAVAVFPSTRLWAIGDFTEAAVGAGRLEEAREAVGAARQEAAVFGTAYLSMLTHRSSALLAEGDRAATSFRLALEAGADSSMPLEHARTQLLHGEWLRRERRVAEAREPLAEALRVFDRAGARPWSDRAAAELRAAGTAPSRETPDLATELVRGLTAQELQIARLAARGLSNREIADQVYASHRTVGAHLYRIFPKLGISSRTQLRDLLAAVPADRRQSSD